MGNPDMFYEMALNNMCRAMIADDVGLKEAEEFYDEDHTKEELEKEVMRYKQKINPDRFYFTAGQADMYTLNQADEMGIDAYNAAMGGLNRFEKFIFKEE